METTIPIIFWQLEKKTNKNWHYPMLVCAIGLQLLHSKTWPRLNSVRIQTPRDLLNAFPALDFPFSLDRLGETLSKSGKCTYERFTIVTQQDMASLKFSENPNTTRPSKRIPRLRLSIQPWPTGRDTVEVRKMYIWKNVSSKSNRVPSFELWPRATETFTLV